MADQVTWGDFEVDFESLLGRGGMGAVYQGRQISLDRRVAIKILDTSRAHTSAFEEGFEQKFLVEAKALARVHDARIITVYQAGKNDGKLWYAMEFIDGQTVEQRLQQHGMFEEADAARIGADVARALHAAHREGIIHRDVKPGNVFLERSGGTKLGDFGIARASFMPPSRLSEANAILGTPEYISPEQGLGDECDHRSDIYSVGIVLYEMLTERAPFGGISAMDIIFQHANEAPESPRILNPAISAGMERIIMRCLAKRPDERYQEYAEFIDDLDRVAAGDVPQHASTGPLEAAQTLVTARRRAWPLALVGVAAIAILLVVAMQRPAKQQELAHVVSKDAPPKYEFASIALPPPLSTAVPVEWPPGLKPPDVPLCGSTLPTSDETVDKFMARYRPSVAELDLIRAMRQMVERGLLSDWRANHTPYTRMLLDAQGALPSVSLSALPELIESQPTILPSVPGIIHATCIRSSRRTDLDALTRIRLPESMSYAFEPRERLVYEIEAFEALDARAFDRVFAQFEQSRAYPRAVKQVLAEFRAGEFANHIAGAQGIHWEPWPKRATGEEQGEFTRPEAKGYLVRSTEQQTISRTLDRAGEGYSVTLMFTPDDERSSWAISFGAETQLEFAGGTMSVLTRDAVVKSAKASAPFRVSFVPSGKLLLVYLGDELAFGLETVLSNMIKIGVARGRLSVAAVETHDAVDEDD